MDKVKLLNELFGNSLTDINKAKALVKCIPYIEEAISTLDDEREECIINKRYSGMTYKRIGLIVLNDNGSQGISVERVRVMLQRALRKLRSPKRLLVLCGEITAKEYFKKVYIEPFIEKPAPPELISKSEGLRGILIEELNLSYRSYNQLTNSGIESLGDLILKSPKELLKIRNFGRKSLNEVIEVLGEMGLGLRKAC